MNEEKSKYDVALVTELSKQLNRPPSKEEIANAGTDSNLVNVTLKQLLVQLEDRIKLLESKK